VQEGAGTIKYLYDLDKVILERNGAGNLLARYTHEGGSLYHDLVSMKRGGASASLGGRSGPTWLVRAICWY